MARILIVDDDPVQLRLTAEATRRADFVPLTASGGLEALKILRADPGISLMILDLVMPDLDGMAVMETMRREGIATPVIIQTAHSELETVVSSLRIGAVDFFVKPVAPERLIVSLRNALRLEALTSLVRSGDNRRTGRLGLADLITRSPAMHRVQTLIAKAAKSPHPVLIEGEAGAGREHLARVIVGLGERAGRPFIRFNCTSNTPAELRAALRSAMSEAQGGTLYLDEIGDLPANAQEMLRDALADGQLADAGAARPEKLNFRLIAATGSRLLNLAASGTFREDLYNRLNVLPVYLPPLRDRREDIAPLAAHFIARFAAECGRPVTGITPPALDLLGAYDWPGNIRQLENILYRAVLLAEASELVPADLPQLLAHAHGRDEAARLTAEMASPSAPVHIDAARPSRIETMREANPDRFLGTKGEVAPLPDIERDLIAFALQHYGGRMSQIARALKIGRSTLYRKLREYGLDDGIDSNAA